MSCMELYNNTSEAFDRISIVCKGLEGPHSELTEEEFNGLNYILSDIRILLKEGLGAADKEIAQWRRQNGIVLNCINS